MSTPAIVSHTKRGIIFISSEEYAKLTDTQKIDGNFYMIYEGSKGFPASESEWIADTDSRYPAADGWRMSQQSSGIYLHYNILTCDSAICYPLPNPEYWDWKPSTNCQYPAADGWWQARTEESGSSGTLRYHGWEYFCDQTNEHITVRDNIVITYVNSTDDTDRVTVNAVSGMSAYDELEPEMTPKGDIVVDFVYLAYESGEQILGGTLAVETSTVKVMFYEMSVDRAILSTPYSYLPIALDISINMPDEYKWKSAKIGDQVCVTSTMPRTVYGVSSSLIVDLRYIKRNKNGIKFKWKCSTAPNYSFLYVEVKGEGDEDFVSKTRISGNIDWTEVTIPLEGPGEWEFYKNYQIRFRYIRDGSGYDDGKVYVAGLDYDPPDGL